MEVESRNSFAPGRGSRGTRRAPSRKAYTRTTSVEIIEILTLAAKDVSQSEISRITGLTQQTVSDIVRRHQPTTDTALTVLKAAAHDSAEHWLAAMPNAVKRGDHRPMKDLLIATGVISPDPQQNGVTILINSAGNLPLAQALQLPDLEAKVLESPAIISLPAPENHSNS